MATSISQKLASKPSSGARRAGVAAGAGVLGAAAVISLPPGPALMAVLSLLVFFAFKAWALVGLDPAERPPLAAWFTSWPGMDARRFAERQGAAHVPANDWIAATLKTVVAAVVLGGVLPRLPALDPLWLGLLGMGAFLLLFHSGFLHLVALVWRRRGTPVEPIMNAPLRAKTLSEFWGRRWNLAFRDFAHQHVFRPTVRPWGVAAATFAVFVFSGLIHDLVISFSAGGGYGLPTLYFLLQGVAVLGERTPLGSRLASRATTAAVILLPLPLLFHRPFGEVVVVPLLHLLGAAP